MKKFLPALAILISISALVFAALSYRSATIGNLAADGTEVPTPVALFQTSLANKITSTATSMTLVSALDKTGTALASSTYAFILDEGLSTEEMVIADCTSTACTNMIRGLSPITGTTTVSALRFEHRRGASVKITDGPQLLILSRIVNGIGYLPNPLVYGPTVATTSLTLAQQLASKAYVDFVGTSGCSNASATVRGCVEFATQAEAASSTTTGGTGALLALGNGMATDTPNSATRASRVLMSDMLGYLKQGWLDLTASFAWSGLHTFSAGFISTASSTNAATTSIPASNALSNAIILNAIPYAFPGVQGASSTVLATNGNGTLSWKTDVGLAYAVDTTLYTYTGSTATTTAKTIIVPINTLVANTIWEVTVFTNSTGSAIAGLDYSINLGTGSATTSIGYAVANTVAGYYSPLTSYLVANSSSVQTTRQEPFDNQGVHIFASAGGVGNRITTYNNGTTQLYISVQYRPENSGDTVKINGIFVRQIQ